MPEKIGCFKPGSQYDAISCVVLISRNTNIYFSNFYDLLIIFTFHEINETQDLASYCKLTFTPCYVHVCVAWDTIMIMHETLVRAPSLLSFSLSASQLSSLSLSLSILYMYTLIISLSFSFLFFHISVWSVVTHP